MRTPAPDTIALDAWTRTLVLLAWAVRHPERAGEIDPARVAAGLPRQILLACQHRPADVRAHGIGLVAAPGGAVPMAVAGLLDVATWTTVLGVFAEDELARPVRERPALTGRAFTAARDALARERISA